VTVIVIKILILAIVFLLQVIELYRTSGMYAFLAAHIFLVAICCGLTQHDHGSYLAEQCIMQ